MEQVGYARVSTREEREAFDRQVDALQAAGCERIFDDRGSATSAQQPGLRACLDYLRLGDVLVVLDLDRLGCLAGELIHLLDKLEARGVGFRALNASFDTTTPMGRAFLQIQAAFAEMERSLIRQWAREGIPAARSRKRGRPRLMTPERLRPRPAPDRRQGPQHSRHLPRTGRRAREHAVLLPACRRQAEGPGHHPAWLRGRPWTTVPRMVARRFGLATVAALLGHQPE